MARLNLSFKYHPVVVVCGLLAAFTLSPQDLVAQGQAYVTSRASVVSLESVTSDQNFGVAMATEALAQEALRSGQVVRRERAGVSYRAELVTELTREPSESDAAVHEGSPPRRTVRVTVDYAAT